MSNVIVDQNINSDDDTITKDNGMLTWEHFLQMLGIYNVIIGHIPEPEDPTNKDGGYWDGDTLANLGFTNIQVGVPLRIKYMDVKIMECYSPMRV